MNPLISSLPQDEVRPSSRVRGTGGARRGTAAPRGGLPGTALRQPARRRVQVNTMEGMCSLSLASLLIFAGLSLLLR